MRHALLSLTTRRRMAVFSLLLLGMVGAHASPGAFGRFKDSKASGPAAASVASEPPSMAMLALGLVGIGLHGLGRARRHQRAP
ncbi:MAG: hypothetical protein EOP36_14580 [Rubrivivax sp.]|nr:MAG: hypothetical protein EOP36_14580 [Rubrivivax sp.]